MGDNISKTGLWIDDATGKVVKDLPKGGGTQLVRPGGTISDSVQSRIDSLDADPEAKPISAAEALGNPVETADVPGDVETTTEPAKRTRATKSS